LQLEDLKVTLTKDAVSVLKSLPLPIAIANEVLLSFCASLAPLALLVLRHMVNSTNPAPHVYDVLYQASAPFRAIVDPV